MDIFRDHKLARYNVASMYLWNEISDKESSEYILCGTQRKCAVKSSYLFRILNTIGHPKDGELWCVFLE